VEEQLTNAPSFAEVWPAIQELLANKTVVIYNANFDMEMLWSSAKPFGIKIPYNFTTNSCTMHLFAQLYGEAHVAAMWCENVPRPVKSGIASVADWKKKYFITAQGATMWSRP
jgi:DNA polymerase III epsilon subunit-like protein